MTISVAESCTGGLIGHRLTQVAGSSAYLDRVLVCYSNEAKLELLDVSKAILARHGAVSSEVAAAMARGVRERSRADVGLSVTGIAGPGGGTAQKPVGLVYVGFDAVGTGVLAKEFRFHGPRDTIKMRASQAALNLVRQWLPLAQRA
jgi:nicotinamide-nucleotide amidase